MHMKNIYFNQTTHSHPGLKRRVFIPRIYYGKLSKLLTSSLVFCVEGLIVSFPDLPESGEQTGMEVYTAESSVAN